MLSTSRIRALALSALPALLAAAAAAPATAAPRKAKPNSQTAAAPKAAPETVYVQVTPPRASAPAPEPREAEAAPAPRRPERSFSGPARDFAQAYGAYLGFYNAEVLGSNPFATLYWDLYPRGQAYFFEFTAGGGTVQSDFSRSVLGADEFENNWLAAFEALGGLAYTGFAHGKGGEGRGGGLFPYFVAGITAVYQGGVPNVGGVIGFGNRMPMPFMGKGSLWALNYGIRDHIYSQKLRNEPSLTQNIVLLIGTQKYF